MLRQQGHSVESATTHLAGLTTSQKNNLLFDNGINFNELPNWQKRGVGLLWEDYEKEAVNPRTGESVVAVRRRVRVESDLPMKDEYSAFIRGLVVESASGTR